MSKLRMAGIGVVILVMAVVVSIGMGLIKASKLPASTTTPGGGGIIVPASPKQSTPSASTSSTRRTADPTPGSSQVPESDRITRPAVAYVTALHGLDYTLAYPGWKTTSFDGILTGALAATQQQRSTAVASGPATAGDQMSWAAIVSNHTVVDTVIEKSSVVVNSSGGGWLVQINWHLSTRSNGLQSRSGSNFTVITVVDVNDQYLASSDVMPQAP